EVGADPTDLCANDAIVSNAIFDNALMGIDLGNDGVGVVPGGPNQGQSAPVLTWPFSDGTFTTVTGYVQGQPDGVYYVQIFVNDFLDPSGSGQGQQLVAALTVSTGDSGDPTFATFAITFPSPLGEFLTATATDAANNTSEFSAGVQIALPGAASGPGVAGVPGQVEATRPAPLSWLPGPDRAADVRLGSKVPDRSGVDAFFSEAPLAESRTALP